MIRRSASIVSEVAAGDEQVGLAPVTQDLLDRELDVVAVGVGDEADVADDRVAVHRAEQQAALRPWPSLGDPVDVVATCRRRCRGG